MSESIPVVNVAAGCGPGPGVSHLKPLSEFYTAGTPPPSPSLAAVLTVGNSAGTKKITNVVDPTDNQDAATKKYVIDALAGYSPSTPTLAAVLTAGASAGTKAITDVVDPTNNQDAATKKYVVDQIALIPPAAVATSYEEWSTDNNYTVSNTDRDTIVEMTYVGMSNGRNFSLYTGAPAGRRVLLVMNQNCNGLFNDNHLGLTGTSVVYKNCGTATTVTQLFFGTNILPNKGNGMLLFVSRGSNTWACCVMETPHKSDGTFTDVNFS